MSGKLIKIGVGDIEIYEGGLKIKAGDKGFIFTPKPIEYGPQKQQTHQVEFKFLGKQKLNW